MARPGRRPRVSSQSMGDDYIMTNEARLSDSEKDRIHPLNIREASSYGSLCPSCKIYAFVSSLH